MTRFFISALALLGMGVMATEASAQFSVYDNEGKVLFTMPTTPAYVDFTYQAPATSPFNGTVGTPVDLGLTSGTLWADHNVGATNASDAGDYYQWGAVTTHYSAGGNTDAPTWKEGYSAGYNWSTYKYMDHSKDSWEGCTKYTFADGQTSGVWYDSEGNFIGDNKKELEDADDVAVQTWGGAWKMPTYEQQTELCNECYWVWTSTYNGENVNGYIVYKAKKDGDKGVKVYSGNTPSSDYDVAMDVHIFLPAAGYRWDTDLGSVGDYGYFWSRSLSTDYSDSAYYLYFGSYYVDWSHYYRDYGFSVRPVCPGVQK